MQGLSLTLQHLIFFTNVNTETVYPAVNATPAHRAHTAHKPTSQVRACFRCGLFGWCGLPMSDFDFRTVHFGHIRMHQLSRHPLSGHRLTGTAPAAPTPPRHVPRNAAAMDLPVGAAPRQRRAPHPIRSTRGRARCDVRADPRDGAADEEAEEVGGVGRRRNQNPGTRERVTVDWAALRPKPPTKKRKKEYASLRTSAPCPAFLLRSGETHYAAVPRRPGRIRAPPPRQPEAGESEEASDESTTDDGEQRCPSRPLRPRPLGRLHVRSVPRHGVPVQSAPQGAG